MTKTCIRCGEAKETNEFYKAGKDGLTTHCKPCHSTRNVENGRKRREKLKGCPVEEAKRKARYQRSKAYNRKYVDEHKELYQEARRRSYWKHKERISARRKELRAQNPEKYKQDKKRRRTNKLEQYRAVDSKYVKRRRDTDMSYRIAGNLRGRIHQAVKKRSESSKDLLGCSIDFFMRHLESQFSPEMSWANYGRYWEIDHVKPCASFDLTYLEQRKACFHWSNTQPLTKADNCSKGAKVPSKPVYQPTQTIV